MLLKRRAAFPKFQLEHVGCWGLAYCLLKCCGLASKWHLRLSLFSTFLYIKETEPFVFIYHLFIKFLNLQAYLIQWKTSLSRHLIPCHHHRQIGAHRPRVQGRLYVAQDPSSLWRNIGRAARQWASVPSEILSHSQIALGLSYSPFLCHTTQSQWDLRPSPEPTKVKLGMVFSNWKPTRLKCTTTKKGVTYCI